MTDFSCPFCRKSLTREDKRYICQSGHSFDIAKEGYVHLLPVNKMHSRLPGDAKEMVLARRRFLSSGYYDIFSDRLCEIVLSYAFDGCNTVDAGCGEGYYTERMKKALCAYENVSVCGFDISKYAAKYAAKSDKSISYAVASIFDIPLPDNSADIVTAVFSPIVEREFYRILKSGGHLIIAVASREHLMGLKKIAYDCPYENEVKDTEYDGFEFVKRVAVRDNIVIDSSELIDDLFTMTPYYLKTSKDGAQRVKQCTRLETPIGFDFIIYKKK